MSNQIIKSFKANEVGFILFEANKMIPLAGSTSFFLTQNSKEYIQVVISNIVSEKDMLFIGDITADYQINYRKYRSLMAVPMVESGTLIGFAIVLHHDPYFFSFETFKLLQSLIVHSTLAFTNSLLREELELLVTTDYLTKLYSRNYLEERIQLSMKNDSFGTLILIDIDDFKQINDTYGHQVGDDSIIQVAELIKAIDPETNQPTTNYKLNISNRNLTGRLLIPKQLQIAELYCRNNQRNLPPKSPPHLD